MRRAPETGETTAAIVARADDRAWASIERRLSQRGTSCMITLLRIPRLRRAYCDDGTGPFGEGISDARLRRLEKSGVIRCVGIDRYALADAAS